MELHVNLTRYDKSICKVKYEKAKTDYVRQYRDTRFVASVEAQRESFKAISRPSRQVCFSFGEETIRGVMLSMVLETLAHR